MEVDNSHNYIKERERKKDVWGQLKACTCVTFPHHYTHTVAHVILCTCMYIRACYNYSDSNQS